jgi:hypothetical protein
MTVGVTPAGPTHARRAKGPIGLLATVVEAGCRMPLFVDWLLAAPWELMRLVGAGLAAGGAMGEDGQESSKSYQPHCIGTNSA